LTLTMSHIGDTPFKVFESKMVFMKNLILVIVLATAVSKLVLINTTDHSNELTAQQNHTLEVATRLIEDDLPVTKLLAKNMASIPLEFVQPDNADFPAFYDDLADSFENKGTLYRQLTAIAKNHNCIIDSITQGEKSPHVDFTLNVDCTK